MSVDRQTKPLLDFLQMVNDGLRGKEIKEPVYSEGKYPFEIIDKDTGETIEAHPGTELVIFEDGKIGYAYSAESFDMDDQEKYEVRFK